MADERSDRPDRPTESEGGSGGDRPRESRPPDDRPPGDRPPGGGRPYGDRPSGGRPPGNKPYGSKPGGNRPYGGRPGNKPYGAKPYGSRPGGGRPYDRSSGPRPQGDRPRDDRGPRPQGGRPSGEGYGGGPPRHDRRVDYSHQDRPRGPRPQRGPREGDRGPRRPRADWDRRDEFAPPRPPRGPSPAELLGEDEEVVAGRRPVEEAFAARREVKRLLVVPERRAALEQLVLHATTMRIPVVEVEGGTITAVSGFDGHQGIALVVAPRRWATLDDVLALAKSRGEPPFVLALDHLEDPQNVGTLLRSAEACGVHGVIFPTRGAAPISPAAIKTSAGAVEHLLLVPMPDLASSLVDLHAKGLRIVGADGDAALTVREADMRGPIVIVTGSEGRGLNAKVRKRVDLMARIPMRGVVASLNASVAGSIFLFEAAAQRDLPEAAPTADPGGGEAVAPIEAAEIAAPASQAPGPDVTEDGTQDTPEAVQEAPEATLDAPEAVVDTSEAEPAEPESSPEPALDADHLLPEVSPAETPDERD